MKKTIATTFLILAFFTAKSQNIRTFNNLELSTSISKTNNQYSVFWGESLQLKSPVPVRFTTGLRFSLNNISSGSTLSQKNNPELTGFTFDKRAWYNTFAIPVGLEFYFKNLGIGAFQEVISFSGKKKYDETTFSKLDSTQTINTQGFSAVFSNKQNLTGGVYLVYTFSDSFSLKAGYNRITSTFTKSNEKKDLGYSKLSNDTFTVGIRLNIEK